MTFKSVRSIQESFRKFAGNVGPRIAERSTKAFGTLRDSLGRFRSAMNWSGILSRLRRLKNRALEGVKAAGSKISDFYLGLRIRWKLILIVAISVVGVTIVVSTIAVNRQEREMRLLTEVLGRNLVRGLANVAKDNLLLESYPPIQDYIKNFSFQGISGLEHFYVINREGVVVAHLNADSINTHLPPGEWDLIASADTTTLIETATHLRFIQSVYVLKDDQKYILGGCSASFSKDIVLAAIGEMKERILTTSSVVSLLAISIVYLLSTKIVGIILILSEAARRVGEGDLKVAVVTRIKDELGILAREFNTMVVQIREKTEMQKFVSRAAVQMISEKKEATLGGTRRVITVMFTDIRNFTSVSENRWPEEVVVTLNHYLDIQTKIIHDNGGVVDKFLGDGIMALFSGNEMIKNAAKTAIRIQQEISTMNKKRKGENEIVLDIGIGIATGVAVMGSIGSQDRMDYTAIGDTVNLASRLCGAAQAREILVSDTVASRLDPSLNAQSAGKISVKGKQERVAVYQIPYSTS